jgi:hypothetical protein
LKQDKPHSRIHAILRREPDLTDFSIGDASDLATNQTVDRALGAIYDSVSTLIGVQRAKFLEDFSIYYRYMFGKSAYVRTILTSDTPENLADIYIPSRFRCNNSEFRDHELVDRARRAEKLIIKGNGGSGKTIFLKYLWLSLFAQPDGRIPLFVELRRLNDLTKVDVATFCRIELQSNAIFTNTVFDRLCAAGKFIFIFDAFDEVNRDVRKDVEKQILRLAELYPDCGVVVTGRDDDRFVSWVPFTIYNVCELNLEEVTALIDKVKFDARVKGKFKKMLTRQFFEENSSFLKSPLLATMMLMTFFKNASIPRKMSHFYESAFLTLLLWHDATKDSFERQRLLPVEEFRKVFSVFCLISYYGGAHEFEEAQLRDYILKTIKYVRNLEELGHLSSEMVDDIRLDFVQSANLLQRDGRFFVFIHRSFQEYFAAECAMRVLNKNVDHFLQTFARNVSDRAFQMAYEIHPDRVIDLFIEPFFQELMSRGIFDGAMLESGVALNRYGLSYRLLGRHKSDGLFPFGLLREEHSLMRLWSVDEVCNDEGRIRDIEYQCYLVGREIGREVELAKVVEADYALSFWWNDAGRIEISMTADGERRLKQAEMARLKKELKASLKRHEKSLANMVGEYLVKRRQRLMELIEQRNKRERSIEELLDI